MKEPIQPKVWWVGFKFWNGESGWASVVACSKLEAVNKVFVHHGRDNIAMIERTEEGETLKFCPLYAPRKPHSQDPENRELGGETLVP